MERGKVASWRGATRGNPPPRPKGEANEPDMSSAASPRWPIRHGSLRCQLGDRRPRRAAVMSRPTTRRRLVALALALAFTTGGCLVTNPDTYRDKSWAPTSSTRGDSSSVETDPPAPSSATSPRQLPANGRRSSAWCRSSCPTVRSPFRASPWGPTTRLRLPAVLPQHAG